MSPSQKENPIRLTTSTLAERLGGESSIHVFLSFRGPDSRQGIVDCLYHFMIEAGILVFEDDEDNPSDEKMEDIFEAIKISIICIPVFSKNYASSKRCLRELARMIELEKSIIPIFYDVTPDDVKLKTSLYVNDLRALNVKMTLRALLVRGQSMPSTEIKHWKKALRDVGSFQGREVKNTGYGEFCEEIIEKVSSILRKNEKRVMDHLILRRHIVEMEDHFKKRLTDQPEEMDAHVEEPKSVSTLEPQEMSANQTLQLSSRHALGTHSPLAGDTDLAKGVASVSSYLPEHLKRGSSTQGHFKPAANYQVVLSFHGDDTRQGFVDVLYHFLMDAAISVFMEDEDKSAGENIAKIFEAIENSMICIVVFSKSYASSHWCLRELARMIELNKKIIPVFYDVLPDDVTLKTSLYVDALEKLQVRKDGPEIKQWKKALQEVGTFIGRELINTGLVDFCKSIAEEVSGILKIKEKMVKDHLVGMDAYVESKSVSILEPQKRSSDHALQLSGPHDLGMHSPLVEDTDHAEGVASVSSYLPEQLKPESSAQGRDFKPAENYQVFLSFHGPDNSQGFVHVLYHSLKDAGIRVFKNEKDKSVGGNTAEIYEAIENSMICIPVLSRNYASSKWCLGEIARMTELNKKIVPVFCDVTPDDVTLKTSLYVDALEALHVPKDGKEIRQWKEALRGVGKITRLELRDASYIKFCKSITQAVLNVLKMQETVVKDHLVGMDAPFVKMLHFLDIEVDDVRYVGVHGMGGVGKTTLARVIFNQLSPRFEYRSFLSDIGETSQRHGIVHLQNQLLHDLRITESFIDNSDGVERIMDTRSGRKVLIVLDDVNQKEQIDKLAGKSSWFAPGSRIIVTSRNEGVLVFEESTSEQSKRVFEMQEVENVDQALQLLSLHAFGTASPPAKYTDLSKKAVSVIGFLPLCLEITGALLRSKSEDYWEETIKALDTIPREDIQQKLRLSYEALDYKTRQIFLDTACFLVGEEQTNAIYIWEACDFDPKTGIEDLVSMSLVKVVGGKLWMHNYVRDLGRDIVDRGKRSRVWRADDALAMLERGEGSKGVEALCMSNHELPFGYLHYRDFTRKSFEKLRELRFLKLWPNEESEGINLVGDFGGLLPNLRWLSWPKCPPHLEAKNLNLVNLVVLDLSRSRITMEWEGWRELKIGNHLKVLDLSHCISLRELPDLSEYPSLERLVLEGCGKLSEIDSSVGKLKALKHLNLIGCEMLWDLPGELYSLENLEELLLRGNSIYFTLSKGFSKHPPKKKGCSKLTSLVNLQLEDIRVRRLPKSIRRCKKLKRLSLRGCRGIAELPDSLGGLKSLVELDISYTDITELPEYIGALKELKVLKIHGTRIRELPGSIRKLVELGKLQVHSSL